jgi:Domain of unknown function (DUF4375)
VSPVKKIPITLAAENWSDPVEVDYAANDTVWQFFDVSRPEIFSDEIRIYYALCVYDNEVKNGGHSQLIHNLLVWDQLWVLDEFTIGADMIGATGFAALAMDYLNWLIANPVTAGQQTGFEGGRAPELDDFDDAYMDLDDNLLQELTKLKNVSVDASEAAFLDECVGRTGRWHSDLAALRIIWLGRSSLLEFVTEAEREKMIADLPRAP